MKRAALLLLVAPILIIARPAPARAQTTHESGVWSIKFAPRPGGNDEILMCSDHDFHSSAEAYNFARILRPKLGFGPGTASFDTVYYKDCVRLIPAHGLTSPGPNPHERTFQFDGKPVFDAAKGQFNLDILELSVCVPSLPSIVSPPPDISAVGACEHPFDREDDWFINEIGSVHSVKVRYRATPASLLLGILGDAAFWAVAVAILFLFARRLRRKQWRFFIRHRFMAWILNILLMLVLVFGAAVIAPYWSGWIQSLQMYLRIGVPGEAFLVTVPALGLCGFMIAGPIRAARPYRVPKATRNVGPEGLPAADVIGIPRLSSERWDARSVTHFVVGVMPFLAFFVLMNDVSAGTAAHIVFLGLAAFFLLGDAFWRRLRLWSARGHDETSRLTLLRSELGSLGAHVSHAFVSEHLSVGDMWLPAPGRFTPISVLGSWMMVWKGMESQPQGVLTGAAIDSLGLNGEWLAVPFLLVDATLGEIGAHQIPRFVIPATYVIGAFLLVRVAIAIIKRRRLTRAATRSPRAVFYLRGLLLRRWMAARRVAPRQPYRSRFLSRRQPAAQIWRSALKSANRFAARANIPAERVQAIVQEVMFTDLG